MPKGIPCEHDTRKRCDACRAAVRHAQMKADREKNPEKYKRKKRAWYAANRERVSLYNRVRHQANKESRHEYFRLRYAKHKTQLAQKRRESGLCWAAGQTFEGLMAQQRFLCAAGCGRDLRKLNAQQVHADHDHNIDNSPNVRGIVCHRCNMGLGLLGDRADTVRKALEYLQNPPGKSHEIPEQEAC